MTSELLAQRIGIDIGTDCEEISAKVFEGMIALALETLGIVSRQVHVPNRGDGKKGRVDLVLTTHREVIPIEIDRKTPRTKSIFKVRSINQDSAFVITRSPFQIHKV